jgi:hypothetical protein
MYEVLVKESQSWTPHASCLELVLPGWFSGTCNACPSSMVQIFQSVEQSPLI